MRRLTDISGEELKEHASSTDFKDRVIHTKTEPGYKTRLDGLQVIDFDVSWKALDETILTAKTGTRIELRQYTPSLF